MKYREGTVRERNIGTACWSCSGLKEFAAGPKCIYPESHAAPAPPLVDKHAWRKKKKGRKKEGAMGLTEPLATPTLET